VVIVKKKNIEEIQIIIFVITPGTKNYNYIIYVCSIPKENEHVFLSVSAHPSQFWPVRLWSSTVRPAYVTADGREWEKFGLRAFNGVTQMRGSCTFSRRTEYKNNQQVNKLKSTFGLFLFLAFFDFMFDNICYCYKIFWSCSHSSSFY